MPSTLGPDDCMEVDADRELETVHYALVEHIETLRMWRSTLKDFTKAHTFHFLQTTSAVMSTRALYMLIDCLSPGINNSTATMVTFSDSSSSIRSIRLELVISKSLNKTHYRCNASRSTLRKLIATRFVATSCTCGRWLAQRTVQ